MNFEPKRDWRYAKKYRDSEASFIKGIRISFYKPQELPLQPSEWALLPNAVAVVGSIVLCACMLILGCNQAMADTIPDNLAVKALIGEFEGEGYEGLKVGACALRNRGTLKGVYGLHANRVVKHLYSDDIEAKAIVAWATSADPKECAYLKGASYWGSTIVDKAWIAKMERAGYVHTITVKNTSFWREK